MTKIYGIKNCDTMKKAFTWLEENGVNYIFHDYKKDGANEDVLRAAIAEHGWENVINRRGTTWKKLPENVKENMDETGAIEVAMDNPSIVKRPLLVHGKEIYLGFSQQDYSEIF
ncbi:MAG: ArsC family reductase [Alphaproteobacteria bacterium]|nr:ArsC family reductase [Alphaproteobacteria bacterium]